MEISPNGSRHASLAPAKYFTGSVIVEPLFSAKGSMYIADKNETAPAAVSPGLIHERFS